jgi:hypothetical protein
MIVDLPSSSTSAVNKKIVELREKGGVLALGRVLTLVIVTDDSGALEDAIEAANAASREHPCRVIVLAKGAKKAAPRLDAQIRVGGDAGASEVIVLRGYGPLASEEAGAGMIMPLLLPDAPVVAWWPGEAPVIPSEDAVGQLAQRRITDALSTKNPIKAFEQRLPCLLLVAVGVVGRHEPFVAPVELDAAPVHGVARHGGPDLRQHRNAGGAAGQYDLRGVPRSLQVDEPRDQPGCRRGGEHVGVRVDGDVRRVHQEPAVTAGTRTGARPRAIRPTPASAAP